MLKNTNLKIISAKYLAVQRGLNMGVALFLVKEALFLLAIF